MTNLQVEHLNKVYKSKFGLSQYPALQDISFDMKEGEFLGIMGPSGSGKSTLLNLIGTIDFPTGGKVYLKGVDVYGQNPRQLATYRRDNIGFIFQDYNLLNTLTVRENIILPLSLRTGNTKTMLAKVRDIARQLGIGDILDKYPFEISGGQQQRTAAARAIITSPKIVLADEPTGNLDSKASRELLELLTFLNRERQTGIMMVTHDIYAASYCRRILFLRDGRIAGELLAGDNRRDFYDRIVEMMTAIGGERE